jgi:hypothetical protein
MWLWMIAALAPAGPALQMVAMSPLLPVPALIHFLAHAVGVGVVYLK